MLIPCAIYLITGNYMGEITARVYRKQLPMLIDLNPHCTVPRHCLQKQFTSYHINSKSFEMAEHKLFLCTFHTTSCDLCYKLHQLLPPFIKSFVILNSILTGVQYCLPQWSKVVTYYLIPLWCPRPTINPNKDGKRSSAEVPVRSASHNKYKSDLKKRWSPRQKICGRHMEINDLNLYTISLMD